MQFTHLLMPSPSVCIPSPCVSRHTYANRNTMNPKPLYLRTLIRSLSLRSSLFSSSFSSKTQLIQAAKALKPCFRSSENDESLMIRSEWDSKLKESVEHLCRQKRLKDVIQLLEKQVHQPSAVLYTTILQLCIEKRALDEGKRVHAHIKRSGFVPGIFISNKILDLYCKCESISDAQTVFDEMGEKDLCSWNILISGYAKMGWVSEARNVFDEMPKRDKLLVDSYDFGLREA
ncbi:UNVERIFIED_CONTAM: Pentatricopeptide repeat-containing protein [Sesamum calycinum]|uniref:Pentatricopeptide repeat-containing protein n=1 Tax=Sesamum calycinum TaxID=2727403 RepID=A0AAW2SX17_9LAMI